MQSRRYRIDRRNSPDAIRRRRAAADERREAMAATLPPIPDDLAPLSVWQRIEVVLYVPTAGRCDQHAVEIDGERVGLLSASQLGVRVRELVRKRPSVEALEDCRRSLHES